MDTLGEISPSTHDTEHWCCNVACNISWHDPHVLVCKLACTRNMLLITATKAELAATPVARQYRDNCWWSRTCVRPVLQHVSNMDWRKNSTTYRILPKSIIVVEISNNCTSDLKWTTFCNIMSFLAPEDPNIFSKI